MRCKQKNIGILVERKYVEEAGDRYTLTDNGRDYFSRSAKRITELQDRIKAVPGEWQDSEASQS
jgi:DNA-binding PadR family transcriptional regulator